GRRKRDRLRQPVAVRRGRTPARAATGHGAREFLSEAKDLRRDIEELDLALAKSRRANDEMRRTLASYRLLFADTLNPIFVVNDRREFVTANAAALRFTECSMKELKKKRPWELGPPDKREDQKKEYSASMSRRTAEMDFLVNGKLKTLLLNFLPLTLGKLSAMFIIGQDLTERKRAEQALRDSEASARSLVNAPTDSVFLLDRTGRVVACNETGARGLGWTQDKLVGTLGYEAFEKEVVDRRRRWIEKVFETGQPVRFQDERTGICFDTVIYPVLDADNSVVRAAVVARDITELELARRSLAEKETALAEAQAIARLGSWERDIATQRERWSDEQYRLFGFEPGEVKPDFELFQSLLHPDDRERILRIARESTAEAKLFECEFRVVRKDGPVRWFRAIVRVFTDPAGNPVRLVGTNLDITERRLAEEAAVESAALARALFDAPTDAVYLLSADGTYIDCNETAAFLLGKTPAEVRGKTRSEVAPSEKVEEQAERVARVVRTGKPFHFETGWSGVNFDVVIYPIPDAYGDVTRVAVVARDITELKKAQQERSDLREQLLHAQKLESLGVLAGGIAHDFNNLLTSILGQADLALLALPLDSPARGSVEEIVKTARRAAGLTNQLLAYSGKGQFFRRVIDLGETVREMENLLAVTVSGKVTLRLETATGIPGVEADVSQIRQVIMNLVMNASEALAGNTGAVTVSVGARQFDRASLSKNVLGGSLGPGTYVYLEVKDTGCGMKPDLVEKAFDPFFTTKFSGRGLGLATVLGIVKAHGGAIAVDSVPGKGTSFTILLPASAKPLDREDERKESVLETVGPGTVLLVDDEDIVREPAGRLLAKLGFKVLTASNGREALEVFRSHADEIDCVVLDLTMPEMSGEEAFRELRRLKDNVKVILSSGYGETESIRSFPGRGPDGFLQKPYRLEQLASKLKEVLRKGGGADTAGTA
ncbi:MAG: PAS domain S-box protein, partial [Candidatus Eisenbacteria bacterium]|nr:PAS domain S-box protein [Candidatus Eisenbacteria bacterium]